MTGSALWWVEWKLAGRRMRREAAVRFAALLFLSLCFLLLLWSGGTDRFLSREWTVTALLRSGVSDEEGEGLARKVATLPPVHGAIYRTPAQAWEEFSERYPDLEALRSGRENPLPGYVEIVLKPERLTEEGMEEVLSALRPLPQVETLLYGGESMSRLFRWKRIANGLLAGGFVFLLFLLFLGFVYQEHGRSVLLEADFRFLRDRGVAWGRLAAGRAAAAALASLCLAVAACAAAGAGLYGLAARVPAVRIVLGEPEEFLDPVRILPVGLYLLSVAAIAAAASWLGGRSRASAERE
ncbi:MAG: hypothetical protein Kow00128_07800 [Deltaproteobacteria bacterium]